MVVNTVLACVNEHFLDDQYLWLTKWIERLNILS